MSDCFNLINFLLGCSGDSRGLRDQCGNDNFCCGHPCDCGLGSDGAAALLSAWPLVYC